jgi:hypothetical protein
MDTKYTQKGLKYGAGIGSGLGAISGLALGHDLLTKQPKPTESIQKLLARNPRLALLLAGTIGAGSGALKGGLFGGGVGLIGDAFAD